VFEIELSSFCSWLCFLGPEIPPIEGLVNSGVSSRNSEEEDPKTLPFGLKIVRFMRPGLI
jgi:hypothetical protein